MSKLSPTIVSNILLFGAIIAVVAFAAQRPGFTGVSASQAKLKWYKGNTHTHTLNSDGDSTPDEVVRWYREHQYQFLVLTDHNYLTGVEGLNALHGADEKFLVIKGEEVTDDFKGKPIHINSLNPATLAKPQGGTSVLDTMQRDVNEIRAARGIPHINHPNFHWAITADDLRQLNNNKLFEIYNGHPQVNNLGGGGVPGLEEMWDIILSSGKLMYGIAVDDAHFFKRPWDKNVSTPGHGWVYVRAESLSAAAIMTALERGEFYASTGVELVDYEATPKQIKVTIKETKFSKYRTQFIGQGGKVLQEVTTSPAVYNVQGNEGYVRAKVIESNGAFAWTQPVQVR
ncbi:MAG TPA: CehA/McbA family metallohydrolase [Blastocatellia bacterium]|nr:CehA/McbA family metallohydrolase [Blastocatellia bacterium]